MGQLCGQGCPSLIDISQGKEVLSMRYEKPEIYPAGDALHLIQSSLMKDDIPVDHESGSDLTTASAYEADE